MANLCQRSAYQARLVATVCFRMANRRSISSSWNLRNLVETPVSVVKPSVTQMRFYQVRDVFERSPNAAKPGRKDYEERVMKALNTFDRYPKGKTLTMSTHLINDMGLDSLDHVELIVALEEEFNCEIPDDIAEKLMTPQQILDYLCEKDKVPEKRTEYHQHGTEPGDYKF